MKWKNTLTGAVSAAGLLLLLNWSTPVPANAAAAQATGQNLREQTVTDARGKTLNYLDRQGRLQRSVRLDKFGPLFGRETTTVYAYDDAGQLLSITLPDPTGGASTARREEWKIKDER